jgi:hypothetical protein
MISASQKQRQIKTVCLIVEEIAKLFESKAIYNNQNLIENCSDFIISYFSGHLKNLNNVPPLAPELNFQLHKSFTLLFSSFLATSDQITHSFYPYAKAIISANFPFYKEVSFDFLINYIKQGKFNNNQE